MHKKHCSEALEAELFKYLVSPRAAAVNGNCKCSALPEVNLLPVLAHLCMFALYYFYF